MTINSYWKKSKVSIRYPQFSRPDFVLCVGEKIGCGISQYWFPTIALVHLANERRSDSAKATDENGHVGHAVARAVSKGGLAEGCVHRWCARWRTGTHRRRRTFIDKRITPRALDPMTSTDACAASHRVLNRSGDHQRCNASGFFAVSCTHSETLFSRIVHTWIYLITTSAVESIIVECRLLFPKHIILLTMQQRNWRELHSN